MQRPSDGYRERTRDTRVGKIEPGIRRLRTGSYFPDWLLERRRRGERALIAVVAECYLAFLLCRLVHEKDEPVVFNFRGLLLTLYL